MEGEWRLGRAPLLPALRWTSAALVAVAFWQSAPTQGWQWLLLGFLSLAYLQDWRVTAAQGIEGIACRQGRWWLFAGDEVLPVELVSWHFLGQRIGVLQFCSDAQVTYTLPLVPGSLSGEGFRRLAVALR